MQFLASYGVIGAPPLAERRRIGAPDPVASRRALGCPVGGFLGAGWSVWVLESHGVPFPNRCEEGWRHVPSTHSDAARRHLHGDRSGARPGRRPTLPQEE